MKADRDWCTKVGFKSRRAAEQSRDHLLRTRGDKRLKLGQKADKKTFYQCGVCGKWHWGHSE